MERERERERESVGEEKGTRQTGRQQREVGTLKDGRQLRSRSGCAKARRVRNRPETKANDEDMVEETTKSKLIHHYDTTVRVTGRRRAMGWN